MINYQNRGTSPSLSPIAAKNLPALEVKTIGNGLKTIAYKDDSNHVLCLQLYIRTGSVKEKPAEEGYSHFIEHLCFKATSDFPANSLSAYASSLGVMLNAFTDYDCTCYYVLLPAEEVNSGLYILSQLACHTRFNEQDVAMEKDVIIEEIKQYENDPEPDFIEFIQVNHFQKSPLKKPVLGSLDSISNASYKSLFAFYKHHYNPNNAFLVACGDFDYDTLQTGIVRYFGTWDNRYALRKTNVSVEPEKQEFGYLSRNKKKGEEFLAFVVQELCEQHPMSDALLIAIRYLAIGKSSRLFKRLVEEEKLCSSVKVSSLSGVLSGASVILTSPMGRKNVARILNVFKEEYCSLMMQGIPEDELHLIKQDVIHSWLYSFEGVENTANLLAAEEFNESLSEYQSYGDKIMAIKMDDVFKAMHQYWQAESIRLYHQGTKQPACLDSFKLEHIRNKRQIYQAVSNQYKDTTTNLNSQESYSSAQYAQIEQVAGNQYSIQLGNGFNILFRQVMNKSVTGFALSSHLSQLCEDENQRGLNFFTSTLMLYGTRNHTHSELMRFSREYGFNIRAIHHLDSTTYRGKCRPEHLDKALSILSEIVFSPRFDSQHLKLLTSAALDGIRRDNDYPVSYAYHKWFEMLVGNNSNLFRSTGNAGDIRSIKLRDINSWYDTWNISRDFHLGIVGSQSPQQIADLAECLFHRIQTSKATIQAKPVFCVGAARYKKQYRETDQAIIHLGGFATPASSVEDNAAFHVLAHILGGDISSRFFDVLREKYGFAYQTGFDFSSVKDLGFWNAYAFCDKKDYNKCLAVMQDLLADVVYAGITELELDNAKKYLVGINRFDHESASYTASSMSNLAALGYAPHYYLNRESRIKAVSLERINSIAQRWLRSDDQFVHILV